MLQPFFLQRYTYVLDIYMAYRKLIGSLNGCIDIMKELRRVDDNIIPRLNSTDTHSEKACGEFFAQLAESYKKREEAVDYCLKV